MVEDIKRLYEEGRLTIVGLNKAATKGWITEEEKASIIESVGDKDVQH